MMADTLKDERGPLDKAQEAGKTSHLAQPPPEAEKILEKLGMPAEGAKAVLAFFSAVFRSTTSVGPDPETAKIMAQAEMHEESTRLDAYRAMLQNRDQQNTRDHEYRLARLKFEDRILLVILGAGVVGAGVGLYLTLSEHPAVGGNLLIASVMTILYVLGGRSPFLRGKE